MSKDRITKHALQAQVDHINRLTHSPMSPWEQQPDGSYKAAIGNYHLSGAYGGVCLERMVTSGGGIALPLVMGYVSKRELYERMDAFIRGLESKVST